MQTHFCHIFFLSVALVESQEYLSSIRNQKSSIHLCTKQHKYRRPLFFFFFLKKQIIMAMITERSQKPDRYHPTFFSLFRNVVTRSKSLDHLYDPNRRTGKIFKKRRNGANVLFVI